VVAPQRPASGGANGDRRVCVCRNGSAEAICSLEEGRMSTLGKGMSSSKLWAGDGGGASSPGAVDGRRGGVAWPGKGSRGG
jgi:hypothetical protein